MLEEAQLSSYLPHFTKISTRYVALAADPALLMKNYSKQSMEALEGQEPCMTCRCLRPTFC